MIPFLKDGVKFRTFQQSIFPYYQFSTVATNLMILSKKIFFPVGVFYHIQQHPGLTLILLHKLLIQLQRAVSALSIKTLRGEGL